MVHPNLSKQFYIHVNTSKTDLGAILTQLDENGNHQVVEYASHALTETQRKYTNSVHEGLGILLIIQHIQILCFFFLILDIRGCHLLK